MGFTWAETITPVVTKVKASHANELHDNIDTDRAAVGLAGYAWTRDPITAITHKVLAADFQEMMDALDEAYDANVCTTHNAANKSGVLDGHDSGYDATNNSGYLNNDHGTYQGAYNKSDCTSHYDSNLSSHDVTYYSKHNVTVKSAYNSIYKSAVNTKI